MQTTKTLIICTLMHSNGQCFHSQPVYVLPFYSLTKKHARNPLIRLLGCADQTIIACTNHFTSNVMGTSIRTTSFLNLDPRQSKQQPAKTHI